MGSLGGIRATNVVKFAHDWQHDGQNICTCYVASEEIVCPTGCGTREAHPHFLSCMDSPAIHSFRKQLDNF